MQLNAEVPLAYIIGIEVRATIPGRNATELKCFDCHIPLPPDAQEGRAVISMTCTLPKAILIFSPYRLLAQPSNLSN